MNWYAVQTRSRHEKVVRDELTRRRVQHYLPTIFESHRSTCRHTITTERPLFPGYIFARINPVERMRVLGALGVVSILGFAGKLEPIPESQIADVRQLVQSGVPYAPVAASEYRVGQRVRAIHGPLEGIEGSLARIKSHQRLVVTVDILGRGAAVEIDLADLEPVKPRRQRVAGGTIATTVERSSRVVL